MGFEIAWFVMDGGCWGASAIACERNIFALFLGLAQNFELLAAFIERLYLQKNGTQHHGLDSMTRG